MVTRNYETLLAAMLTTRAVDYGSLPVRTVAGLTRFMSANFCYDSNLFPCKKITTPTTDWSAAGISIGSGDRAPQKDDFNLQRTITSGVNLVLTNTQTRCNAPGTPYLEYRITVTNTGNSAITVSEIGYKQNIRCGTFPGATSGKSEVFLLDRTVLETPITIQPGDAGVINYCLQTTPTVRTKAGVELVSFTWGTDEQICAMIDAARNGDIDLQEDGGWRVGDARAIYVDAFTGGNFTNTAKYMDIVITQFGDYNNCGCLFQFDFAEILGEARLSANSSNAGGYGATEMYATTLPAMVEALPSWLKTRLKTFDVLVSAGSKSSSIDTVSGNKLALRSEVELLGTTSKTPEGEGSFVSWYRMNGKNANKEVDRCIGDAGMQYYYWMRSPDKTSTYAFCYMNPVLTPAISSSSPDNVQYRYFAPFGCL